MTSDAQNIPNVPLELWRAIESYLPNSDIKSMRLASQQFRNTVELRLQRVFLSANPLNIKVFRAVADHEKFRHGVTEIVWDDARFSRGPRKFTRLPGLDDLSDADISDNETEESFLAKRRRGANYDISWDVGWDFYDSDLDTYSDDEEEEEGIDPVLRLKKCDKFKDQDCPLWYKATCVENVKDIYWRQGSDQLVDTEDPRVKTMGELGEAGFPLGECWKLYRELIRQQDDVLAGNYDEEAFLYGLKQFPALKKVTITPAAHGVASRPLYQTPMIRAFPQGFNYPIPRGWPVPCHGQSEEVTVFPWQRLSEQQKEKYRGFRIVTRALAHQKHNVLELSLDACQLRTGVNCTILDDPCEEYDYLATVLNFTIRDSEGEPNWQSFRNGRLYQALSGACDIEGIRLYTAGLHAWDEGKDLQKYTTSVSLKSIFPFAQWYKLRHFALSRFIVTQSDLISCLAGLPETLQSVELSFLIFVDNDNYWHSVVTEMRKQIREKRLWLDRRPNITIGCERTVDFPGRAWWLGKEL